MNISEQAGLFSAVLTAFNVQSYTLLAPDDPQDRVLETLQQISAQLSSFSVNPSFLNSTTPAVSQIMLPPSRAPLSAVWLNVLWFSSLIFSLSAASIGIMVKQWLNEYRAGLSGSSRQTARLRQQRLNSLIKWRVASIVAILPVLLQIALALFLSGLLILLWGLNDVVAGVASALTAVLFIVTAASNLLPSLKRDCCYISPPAYWFFIVLFSVKRVWYHVRRTTWTGTDVLIRYACARILSSRLSWSRRDRWLSRLSRLHSSLWTEDPPSCLWRGWEIQHVSANSDSLDGDIVTMAYTTTLNPVHLDNASPCLSTLSLREVLRCSMAIHEETVRHWTNDTRSIGYAMPKHFWSEVWVAVLHTLGIDGDDGSRAFQEHVKSYFVFGLDPQPNNARFASLTANVCSVVHDTRRRLDWLHSLVLGQNPSSLTTRTRQSSELSVHPAVVHVLIRSVASQLH